MEEEILLAVAHATWRIASWGTILGAFNIKYISRTSVKGQDLIDLVAKIAEPLSDEMTKAQQMGGKSVGTVSLHRTFHPEGYMLMALQIKVDPKWD